MVRHSHFFKDLPLFAVVHTVKGFCIVNEAEVDIFLELFGFLHNPAHVNKKASTQQQVSVVHSQNERTTSQHYRTCPTSLLGRWIPCGFKRSTLAEAKLLVDILNLPPATLDSCF